MGTASELIAELRQLVKEGATSQEIVDAVAPCLEVIEQTVQTADRALRSVTEPLLFRSRVTFKVTLTAAEKQRRYRDKLKQKQGLGKANDGPDLFNGVTSPVTNSVTLGSPPFPPKEVSPHTPLQEITPLPPSSVLSVSKRKPTTYTEGFENFWLKYPRTPTMSKLEASRAWQRLTEADQNSALQAIEPYRRFLRQKPNLETVHAVRFLSQRRFEGFCEPAAPAAPLFDVRRHLV